MQLERNKFKNANGGYLLKALFFEETLADKSSVVYTLKNQDHLGYPSLYRLYMEADDPTEYTFAVAHLDGWEHWQRLCDCTWFKPYIEAWRKELDVRFRARALKNIYDVARAAENPNSYQANKFLVVQGWKTPEAKKRGAPSKAEVQAEAKRMASITQTLEEDFERITGKAN